MAMKRIAKKSIQNRRAWFDYQLGDSLVTGLVLNGNEVRSLREGRGQLRGAYATVKNGELWLVNATISGTMGNAIEESIQTRDRKILVKERELKSLLEAKQQGKSIIPVEILTGGKYIKLRLAIGKGKRQYDKRQTIKRREQDRQSRGIIKYR